jgi:hypothetical protein
MNNMQYVFNSVATTTADVSEFFRNNDPETTFGHVVSMGTTTEKEIVKTTRAYDSKIVGVISEDGTRMGDNENSNRINDPNYKNVCLLGQLRTFVSL